MIGKGNLSRKKKKKEEGFKREIRGLKKIMLRAAKSISTKKDRLQGVNEISPQISVKRPEWGKKRKT